MTAFRALLVYEDFLRSLQKVLSQSTPELESMLESSLGFLSTRLRLQTVTFFRWFPKRNSLGMQYIYHADTLLEGEEELIVEASSPLHSLVDKLQPVVISKSKPWIAFIPIQADGELLGALRLERGHPLPRGKTLLSLPSIQQSHNHTGPRLFPLLEDIADIFSIRLQQLLREEKHRRKTRYLQAGSEVATAVFERPRLRDMLETVCNSIVQNLGFDRIRFYLVDSARKELKGILGLQIPGRLMDLETESYPLKPNVNALVDAVLQPTNDNKVHLVADKVVFSPMVANQQVVGCLAVDNLLSQQPIDEDQIGALKRLAAQIGMAVLNARLFEDIEQQAITDGLTKLYVFRYFQQRLKEEIDRADRYSYSVALVMMDVDNFKKLNDQYGHPMGDSVLEFLAQTIRGNIRRIDLAARYGGDEFVLVLPEIVEQEAWLMGARVLNAIKQGGLRSPSGEAVNLAVTMGVSLYPNDAKNGRDLIEAADRALYWGKKNNRGDISFYKSISNGVEHQAL